jgi:cytochrome c biogenesis protein CcdA
VNELNLAFAFTAGLLATLNPCGWAMLPAFVSYHLGLRQANYKQKTFAQRITEGLTVGLLVTGGFVAIFGIADVVLSAGLRLIVAYMPLAAFGTGVVLVLFGTWLLAGKSLPFPLPLPQVSPTHTRGLKSAFVFGIGYAFASLSCTLPIFLAVVGTSLSATTVAASALMFGAYGAGMAAVLVSVALGATLLNGAVARWLRQLLPHVHRLSAGVLVLAGLYLIWYQSSSLPLLASTLFK